MADTSDNRDRDRQPSTGDPRVGAPRPAQTGSVTKVGFDDPTLRPQPGDRLDYHSPHSEAHPEWHEHSDVPIRPLAWALFSIAALCVVSMTLLYVVFGRYEKQQKRLEVPRTAISAAKPPVPEPRLEGIPGYSDNPRTQDLQALRRQHEQELNGFGPSPEQGFAQIPIDRAMDLAVERGMFKAAPAAGGGGARTGAAAGTQKGPAPQSQRQQAPPQAPPRKEGTR